MGHKRTIKPNAKKLSPLFMKRDKMDWDTFSKKVKASQRGFMGEPDEMRPGRGEFHEYPASCICQKGRAGAVDTNNEEDKGRHHEDDEYSEPEQLDMEKDHLQA